MRSLALTRPTALMSSKGLLAPQKVRERAQKARKVKCENESQPAKAKCKEGRCNCFDSDEDDEYASQPTAAQQLLAFVADLLAHGAVVESSKPGPKKTRALQMCGGKESAHRTAQMKPLRPRPFEPNLRDEADPAFGSESPTATRNKKTAVTPQAQAPNAPPSATRITRKERPKKVENAQRPRSPAEQKLIDEARAHFSWNTVAITPEQEKTELERERERWSWNAFRD